VGADHSLLALLVLYWYKCTNTHAKGAAAGFAGLAAADELHALGCKVVVLEVLVFTHLLALQVQKYKYLHTLRIRRHESGSAADAGRMTRSVQFSCFTSTKVYLRYESTKAQIC
jgi:hypothetical protein